MAVSTQVSADQSVKASIFFVGRRDALDFALRDTLDIRLGSTDSRSREDMSEGNGQHQLPLEQARWRRWRRRRPARLRLRPAKLDSPRLRMEYLFQSAGRQKIPAILCSGDPRQVPDVTPFGRNLDGKAAIVTGASQGLGEAVAREFAARGVASLLLTGRNRARGEAIAASLAAEGCDARFHAIDLADLAAVREVVPAAERAFGRVDILVNAAGDTDRGTIFDTSPELYERIMAVNLRAPFFLIQDAAEVMRRLKIEGAIVNIQSMSAHGGQPFLSAYSVSKAGLAALTKNAAYGLLPHRIRVNGLNIGWMATPGEDAIMRSRHGAQDGWLEKAASGQPFGRLIDPREVAKAVAYLASAESGLMTGSNIDFDQTILGAHD
jgi:NAD(P)-dependent dehydrogenase (short-subunit alcohol dehydrogenase family)